MDILWWRGGSVGMWFLSPCDSVVPVRAVRRRGQEDLLPPAHVVSGTFSLISSWALERKPKQHVLLHWVIHCFLDNKPSHHKHNGVSLPRCTSQLTNPPVWIAASWYSLLSARLRGRLRLGAWVTACPRPRCSAGVSLRGNSRRKRRLLFFLLHPFLQRKKEVCESASSALTHRHTPKHYE